MKPCRVLLPITFLALCGFAGAIVIVPPVVYIASLSVLSVMLNLFAGVFFWIALQGIATKSFFGKPFSVIMAFLLPTAGKLLFAMLLAIVFSIIFSPVSLVEALLSALAVAIIFFFSVLLSRYRQIRNTMEKSRPVSKILTFSLVVFALCLASIMLSIGLQPVAAGARGRATGFYDIFPVAQSVSNGAAGEAKTPLPANEVGALWLVPTSAEECTLQAGSELLFFTPKKSCLKSATSVESTFCPIEILPSQIMQKGSLTLKAGGSCSGAIVVVVKENSFGVAAK